MRVPLVVLATVLTISARPSSADRVRPIDYGDSIDPTRPTVLCALSDEDPLHIDTPEGRFKVYSAARNRAISVSSIGLQGVSYHYYVQPHFAIPQNGGVRLSSNKRHLLIRIVPVLPTFEEIRSGIAHNGNPDVREANIHPVCALGVKVTLKGAGSSFELNAPGGLDLGEPLDVDLPVNSGTAPSVLQSLKQGQALTLTYTMLHKLSQVRRVSIRIDQLKGSDVNRDYVSPVNGNTIWAFQALIASRAAAAELAIDFYREGADKEGLGPVVEGVFDILFKRADEQVIAFDALDNVALAHLTDFDKTRFNSDVVRKLAYDVKNSSNDEWCRKARNEYKTLFESGHEGSGEGGGGFNFVKLFSLKGSGKKKTTDKLKQSLSQLMSSQDCGKAALASSFDYLREGDEYIPKGIIAHEVLSDQARLGQDKTIADMNVDQEYRNTAIPVVVAQ